MISNEDEDDEVLKVNELCGEGMTDVRWVEP